MNYRIIARLDIKGPNLVKGIHLEGLRVLGKPEVFAKHYYETGADELIYMDVVASLYGRNSLHDIITRTAQEIFIPLTVGGGIRTIEDMNNVLRAGADKICVNTSAVNNPDLIRQASRKFGSSTIVVAIEVMKQLDGRYLVFTDNGREYTGKDALAWAQEAEELGAGEILLTSVDNEGTGKGFDITLTERISNLVSIPVIAHGGCGKKNDIVDVLRKGGPSAVAIASLIHYDCFRKHEEYSTEEAGNTEFLKSGKSISTIQATGLLEIKRHLLSCNMPCRN